MSAEPFSASELDAILSCARRAAAIGRDISRERFRTFEPTRVDQKTTVAGQGDWNPVTEVDRTIEREIVASIHAVYPDHSFLGEENIAGQTTDADHTWIIDPIDGTSNYLHGMPHYAIAVGYAWRGRITVSVCVDPERDETFCAIDRRGAWLNDVPLHVADTCELSDALVSTGFYYDRGEIMERTLTAIRSLFGRGIHGIRRTGSAVLDISWVAAGRFDAFFEYQLAPWDYLPAALIAREAGAVISAVDGSELGIDSGSAICCTRGIYADLQRIVASTIRADRSKL